MSPEQRSLAGLALAIILIPVLAGLLACLPVPIGDPEQSRIDSRLNGIWLDEDLEAVWVFQPYDKRTWLITRFVIEAPNSANPDATQDIDTYESLVHEMQTSGIGKEGFTSGKVEFYKVWRTKLAKQQFLTWERKGYLDDTGIRDPETWIVFRIDEVLDDRMSMSMIDGDFSGFKELEESRRAYERAIRRNVNNSDMYGSAMAWIRVREEHLELFSDLAGEILSGTGN